MICLKNRTFAVSQTTQWFRPATLSVLWFAWKIVLLQYRKQPNRWCTSLTISCDLLEKSYFCSIANNQIRIWDLNSKVVICLKNRTFAVSQTTPNSSVSIRVCCDLLEKSYFCSIANNEPTLTLSLESVVICLKNRTFAVSQTTVYIAQSFCYVVICLKNRTFAVSQTTSYLALPIAILLWFAWKIVLLQYRKQPKSHQKA